MSQSIRALLQQAEFVTRVINQSRAVALPVMKCHMRKGSVARLALRALRPICQNGLRSRKFLPARPYQI